MSEAFDDTAGAIEIAAVLGDSVVDVKHCIDPRRGKVTRRTQVLLIAGAACMLASVGSFASSVHTASRNQAAFDEWTHVDKRPASAFRPVRPGLGYDWVAFGGFALGILATAGGLLRMRDDQDAKSRLFYRIGTAAGVELPIAGAPTPDFSLVAPRGDDFVFQVATGIEGELMLDGATLSFAELAASGRLHPSTTTAGALELVIPDRAKIRARVGQTTFLVSAVARPRRQPSALLASLENRTLAYVAGSLAVHLGIVALLQLVPEEAGAANAELSIEEPVPVNAAGATNDDSMALQQDSEVGTWSNSGAPKMVLEEGQAGIEHSTNHESSRETMTKRDEDLQTARAAATAMAQNAGILGNTALRTGGTDWINGFVYDGDLTKGFDDTTSDGAMFGADSEDNGHFGAGRNGFDVGGGSIASGGFGTSGGGHGGGTDYGIGVVHDRKLRGHTVWTLNVCCAPPNVVGDLDKGIIRRYIKRQASKLSYCYEKQLLAQPTLAGDITVQFFIMPNGAVKSATAAGFDPAVASCVADVIRDIEFPASKGGGGVQVNYPLTFREAGQ
jgi:hypothetical protein